MAPALRLSWGGGGICGSWSRTTLLLSYVASKPAAGLYREPTTGGGATLGFAHGDDQHGDPAVQPERRALRDLLRPVRHWLPACLLLAGACAGSPGTFEVAQGGSPGATGASVKFAREFKLRDGEAAHVGNDGLVIRFERVTEDARCPVGNTCVSVGDAVVLVTFASASDPAWITSIPDAAHYDDDASLLTDMNPATHPVTAGPFIGCRRWIRFSVLSRNYAPSSKSPNLKLPSDQ